MVTLRELRHSRHMSLGDLALLSGLSEAMLSRVERGERRLSPTARIAIVRGLAPPLGSPRDVRELAPDEGPRASALLPPSPSSSSS